MNPKIPQEVEPLLAAYQEAIEREAPGLVTGFYLAGSIALGAFSPRLSDIDFVGVLSRAVEPEEYAVLLAVHQAVEGQYPTWKMEGVYLQAGDLGRGDEEVEPHPSYHDGKLKRRYELLLSGVTWWTLLHHGLAVWGPEPQALGLEVDWDDLLARMRANLNSYWAGWADRPVRWPYLLTDYGVQWCVLGVLRQLYTFRERDITSKTGAGEYALTCVPERWHPIIREAMALRETPPRPVYRSRLKRALDTRSLVGYVVREGNTA